MFKKLAAILLATVMTVGMATTAFAAESNVKTGSFTLSEVISTVKTKISSGGPATSTTAYKVPRGSTISVAGSGATWSVGSFAMGTDSSSKEWNIIWSDGGDITGKTFEVPMTSPWDDTDDFVVNCTVGSEKLYLLVTNVKASAPTQKPAESDKAVDTTKPAATQQPANAVTATGGTAYVIRSGDTFGKLSLNFYGDMKYHKELYAYNAAAMKKSNGELYVGQQLVIPAEIVKGVYTIAQPTISTGEKFYTVKAGDTLGTIALAELGKMSRYNEIFNRNSDRIENTNTIYEGQIIVIPAK